MSPRPFLGNQGEVVVLRSGANGPRSSNVIATGLTMAGSAAISSTRKPAEGRPSIPPEKLLRALILQILYSVRSERQLMEQLDYNLLFRWFVLVG